MERHPLPGKPYPLGATWDGIGVNFSLYSENATHVELCLYDSRTRRERARVAQMTPVPSQASPTFRWNSKQFWERPEVSNNLVWDTGSIK